MTDIRSADDQVERYYSELDITTADQLQALIEERDRLRDALTEIACMGYAGAPDIAMRRIARAALAGEKQ